MDNLGLIVPIAFAEIDVLSDVKANFISSFIRIKIGIFEKERDHHL